MAMISEYGPTDSVISENYYRYNNEVSATTFYTRWFDYPDISPILGNFNYEDVRKCKDILFGIYSGLDNDDCIMRTISIDRTPVLLIGSENSGLPGISVFKKIDDDIEMAGTISGTRNVDDIKYYNALGESYWYYANYSVAVCCGEDSSSSTEQTDVFKIELKEGKLSEKTHLRFYAEHNNDVREFFYKIGDHYVSKEEYFKRLALYSNKNEIA